MLAVAKMTAENLRQPVTMTGMKSPWKLPTERIEITPQRQAAKVKSLRMD